MACRHSVQERVALVAAVILAGSRPGQDPVAAHEGLPSKALVDIGGTTALERVIDAVRGAGIERIVVAGASGPVAQAAAARGIEVMAPAPGPSGSVMRALDRLGAPLLVTTADHPLLRPEWIRFFIADAPQDADVVTMLASRARVEAAVPGSRRTWLTFSDGQWSGCNLFLLRTPEARRALLVWEQVEKDRKRPWRIARRIGPITLARYLLKKLPSEEAFARLGRKMGVKAGVVAAPDGLAAVDVDTVADLQLVRSIVAGRSAASNPAGGDGLA
jgi:CTP:molybdopterin cytidylyltransferase MocA